MKKSDIKNSSDMYLYKSKVDFNSAHYLLEAYNEDKIQIDIEKIYFEIQQSAEKVLKSIITKNGISFPKTHDLEQLINICNNHEIKLVNDIEYLIDLNDYAVEGRYSIIHDDINDATKYLTIINSIYELIEIRG